MRILNFSLNGAATLGVRRGEDIIDLAKAAPDLPGSLEEILALGPDALQHADTSVKAAGAEAVVQAPSSLLPPLMRPAKIICLGLNYRGHARETNQKEPDYPPVFCRFASSLIGHNTPIIVPGVSHQGLDYEGELVAVVGKRARHVQPGDALDVIAGYSIFNDASERIYQRKSPQWTMGKNFDATGAFGPEFVTSDELPPGAQGLSLQTILNGETLQDGNTSDMIFGVADLVVLLSECMTLEPGDLIVTGTPAGVGWVRDPQKFMHEGDTCEVKIDGIGSLVNTVVQEKSTKSG